MKYSLWLLLAVMAACVSEFNANIPFSGSNILVVEGNIISDTVVNFYFSKSFSLEEATPPEGYDDVAVNLVVVGSDGYRSAPATYLGKGVHQITIDRLNSEVSYGIEFEYEGDSYRSIPAKPLHTPEIDSISWVQPVEEEDVTIRVSTHDDTKNEPLYFLWNYDEDWEILARYGVDVFFDPIKEDFYYDNTYPVHYCWKKNRGKQVLVGATETLVKNSVVNKHLYHIESSDDRFNYLYSTLIKQQSITKSAYEYYLDKAKASEGMGGLFTPQPSKMEGNIVCVTDKDKNAIGFVGVVNNITEKRIYIKSGSISKRYRSMLCSEIDSDSIRALFKDGMTYIDLYNMGHRPVYRMGDEELWAIRKCTNCIDAGGSKNKPDFWPNNHK